MLLATSTYSQHPSLSSILISRFILDLRNVSRADQSDSQMTSSMRFAEQVSATFGAPLDEGSAWVTDAMDNVADPIVHSDDPVAEGVVPKHLGGMSHLL